MSNPFARIKNWKGGDLDPAAVDEEFRNLRRTLKNLNDGTISWSNINAANFSITSQLLLPNGSAATPALAFTNETNTGLYLRQAGAFDVTIQGTQVLEIDSSGNVSLALSGGKLFYPSSHATLQVMQVVQAVTTTQATVGSTSFTNTNLSVTITPKYSTSNVLVFATGVLGIGAGANAFATVARGSTNLFGTGGFCGIPANNNTNASVLVYDNPATVSATTYNLQIRSDNAAVNTFFPLTVSGVTSTAQMVAIEFQ